MKKVVKIYFDGFCIFCDAFAVFVAKRDSKKLIRFGYLQDLKNCENFDSVIVEKNGQKFKKSSAIIIAISALGFPYNLIKIFLIIPQKLRDVFYDFFGRNRYKWFGKKEFCESDKEIRNRLD